MNSTPAISRASRNRHLGLFLTAQLDALEALLHIVEPALEPRSHRFIFKCWAQDFADRLEAMRSSHFLKPQRRHLQSEGVSCVGLLLRGTVAGTASDVSVVILISRSLQLLGEFKQLLGQQDQTPAQPDGGRGQHLFSTVEDAYPWLEDVQRSCH